MSANASAGSTPPPGVKVGSAPAAFGIDEILVKDAWMPAPEDVLDWIVELDYAGTELGPPGYLAPDAATLHERLSRRGLELVGSFLPQHFSRDEKADEDRAWLRDALRMIREGSPEGSHPFAILSDQFDEPERIAWSGRIADHPEASLSPARFETMIANLHRAAELARDEGFEVVLHPHAGTYIETRDEIARVMDRIDPSLLGLCLDTGHFTPEVNAVATVILVATLLAASSARWATATRTSTPSSLRCAGTPTADGSSSSRTSSCGPAIRRRRWSPGSAGIGSISVASGCDGRGAGRRPRGVTADRCRAARR